MRFVVVLLAALTISCSHQTPRIAVPEPPMPAWLTSSNDLADSFTKALAQLHPEIGSDLGYNEFDKKGQLFDADLEFKDLNFFSEWSQRLAEQARSCQDPELKTDILILQAWVDDQVRKITLERDAHVVSFFPAALQIYTYLQTLANPLVPIERKKAAVDRFHVYVQGDATHKPLLIAHADVTRLQIKNWKQALLPYRVEVETSLKDTEALMQGIRSFLQASERADALQDWEAFTKQIKDYNVFVRSFVLPHSRRDFRLTPKIYANILRQRQLDTTPAQLIALGQKGYQELYPRFVQQAALVADQHGWREKSPAGVIGHLKQLGLHTNAAREKLYHDVDSRLAEIMRKRNLISVPATPLKMWVADIAETQAGPVPHLLPPPLGGPERIQPVFVIPNADVKDAFDDFSAPASALILLAHEGRPGHEMQFTQMLDHGVSTIRSRYAANSVNIEGWAVYAEDLVYPDLSSEELLFAQQIRLWRMARTFLDPQLQLGQIQGNEVIRLFTQELGVSETMAHLELRRYSYGDVGQAPSYYYGYLLIQKIRAATEQKWGPKFNLKCFNDQLLSYGLLPLQMTLQRLPTEYHCD